MRAPRYNHSLGVTCHGAEQLLDRVRRPFVVGIEKRDELVRASPDRRIASGGDARVRLPYVLDPLGILTHDIGGAVRAPVIHDDDITEFGRRLIQRA